MEEIISLVVANGLWAVLFCGLLVYELRDSRAREKKYTQTIRALSERLDVVTAVKADTTGIKTDAETILSDTDIIKRAVATRATKVKASGVECAKNLA